MEGQAAANHAPLSAAFSITGQQEVDRAIGYAEHDRVLVLVGIQRLGGIQRQGCDLAQLVALAHPHRGSDHVVIRQRLVQVQAGAGVVADSIPELEYLEVKNKLGALLSTIKEMEDI